MLSRAPKDTTRLLNQNQLHTHTTQSTKYLQKIKAGKGIGKSSKACRGLLCNHKFEGEQRLNHKSILLLPKLNSVDNKLDKMQTLTSEVRTQP